MCVAQGKNGKTIMNWIYTGDAVFLMAMLM